MHLNNNRQKIKRGFGWSFWWFVVQSLNQAGFNANALTPHGSEDPIVSLPPDIVPAVANVEV